MDEIKNYLEKNGCFKSARKLTEVRGVLIHDTATPGATPEAFARSWNTLRPNGRPVCVHAFADDKKIINTLPYGMRCWGCGSGARGSGNDYYIQIEICDNKEIYINNGWEYKTTDKDTTFRYVNDVADVVSTWAAQRLFEAGITEVSKNSVTSHYEAHKMGLASNHADPMGFLRLGGLDMDKLRIMISVKLAKLLNGSPDVLEPSENFLVKVTTSWLNVRSGPGTSYNILGSIKDCGVYTIIETDGSWGRLKSGAGWISLKYTRRL